MIERSEPNMNMIYTPNSHIPIGEAVRRPDGSHALRIKNPKTKKIDEITLDKLCEAVISTAKAAETRTEQGPAAS